MEIEMVPPPSKKSKKSKKKIDSTAIAHSAEAMGSILDDSGESSVPVAQAKWESKQRNEGKSRKNKNAKSSKKAKRSKLLN